MQHENNHSGSPESLLQYANSGRNRIFKIGNNHLLIKILNNEKQLVVKWRPLNKKGLTRL